MREIDQKYVRWIHSWPCAVPDCGTRYPVHAHHVKTRGAGGSDRTCIPLCAHHHVFGGSAVHNLGKHSFEKRHHLVLEDLVQLFNKRFEEGQEGPFMDCLPPISESKFKTS